MRYGSIVFLMFVAMFFLAADVLAQSSETEVLKDKVDKLEKELTELKDLLKQQTERDMQKEKEFALLKEEVQKREVAVAPEVAPGEEFYFARKAEEIEKKELGAVFRDAYSKPFLRRFGRNTYVGGYMDFIYKLDENDNGNHGFDQTRLVPFIFSDVSDRVKFATEIEIEHGGIGGGRDGDVKLEFATIDFLITDWLNYRGGFILTPLGKFNLVHDTPLQDFAERPMVNRLIIPTTLTDTGMGFFGSLYPTELSKLDYEIYVTNGAFHGLDENGVSDFNLSNGLRDARGGFEWDNENQSPGVVGRVAFSPFIGLEFGGSAYTQRYDDKNDNQITISALDFAYQRGAFELVGEGAYAFIETDDFAEAAGIADSMWGYYIEPRYHFMPPFLMAAAPRIFTENSTFTGAARWEQVQTSEKEADGRVNWLRTRITPGLNYRYTEDTVFTLGYQFNIEQKDMPDIANNAFVFSIATYF